MPRVARKKSSSGALYHIIECGNERQDIFREDEDRRRLLTIIKRNQEKYGFTIHAFCLMTNHIHLLISCDGIDISQVMKSINVSYVIYFNRKYERSGHLFQDRFKSEIVDTNEYAMEVTRYIHLNPVRAGMVGCDAIHKYIWSSYQQYLLAECKGQLTVDTSFILGLFSADEVAGRKEYREYVLRDDTTDKVKDMSSGSQYQLNKNVSGNVSVRKPEEVLQTIAADCGFAIEEIKKKRSDNVEHRNTIIRALRSQTQLSLKEIGQLIGGLSESMISRIVRG